MALALFSEVWERRDGTPADAEHYPVIMTAGVAVAAHLEVFDQDPDDEVQDAESILAEIDETVLSDPGVVVYETLVDGDSDASPEDLAAQAEKAQENDQPLAVMENNAFAALLDTIQ